MSVEQGYDPRNFSLVAFGGAGPLHANSLGKLLGAYPVIVPPSPGVLCAFGDATTLLRHEVGRAFPRILGQASVDDVVEGFDGLLAEARKVMQEDQEVADDRQVLLLDLHYSIFTRILLIILATYLSSRSQVHWTGEQRSSADRPRYPQARWSILSS